MLLCFELIIVLGIFFVDVNGEGKDPGIPKQDYSQVFRDIPTVFEHVIDMLHERPQVLEKDDVTTFLETVAANDKVFELDPDGNERKVVKRESNIEYDFSNNFSGDSTGEFGWYLLRASDDYGGFISSAYPGGSQLTSEEVADMVMMVEKKLEERDNDTN